MGATSTQPRLILVAAVAADGGIGRGNELLFKDKADSLHLRAITMGHPVVMGRKTWQSLPERYRPLPGRRNVVLTRDASFVAEGAETAPTLQAAMARLSASETVQQVCVLGGGEIYAQAMPLAHGLEITHIGRSFAGADAFFPSIDLTQFEAVAKTQAVAADGTPMAFVRYERRKD